MNSFKVIAIHLRYIGNNYNTGELIKNPIIDYYQKCNLKNRINEIEEEKRINENNKIIEIKKNDINKTIYFLDNTEKHDNLKELNENNIKLYYGSNNHPIKHQLLLQKNFLVLLHQ